MTIRPMATKQEKIDNKKLTVYILSLKKSIVFTSKIDQICNYLT